MRFRTFSSILVLVALAISTSSIQAEIYIEIFGKKVVFTDNCEINARRVLLSEFVTIRCSYKQEIADVSIFPPEKCTRESLKEQFELFGNQEVIKDQTVGELLYLGYEKGSEKTGKKIITYQISNIEECLLVVSSSRVFADRLTRTIWE